MFCPNCGKEISSNKKFCSKCGISLKYRTISKFFNFDNKLFLFSLIIVLVAIITIPAILYLRGDKGISISSKVEYSDLSPKEINEISKLIVDISCGDQNSEYDLYFGSGIYAKIDSGLMNDYNEDVTAVITNAHVASDDLSKHECKVIFHKDDNNTLEYWFDYSDNTTEYSETTDMAVLRFNELKNEEEIEIRPLEIGSGGFQLCRESDLPSGTKIYVFGYPSSGSMYYESQNLIVTDGIIGGKEDGNYITTAQMDTGNSGGLAVAKINNNICIVGIPTSGILGDAQILGVI